VFSPALAHACIDSVLPVTTAKLHYIVVNLNTKGDYGQPTLAGYYDRLSSAFRLLSDSQTQCQKPRSVSGDKTLFIMLDYALFLQVRVYKDTVSFPSLGRGC